MGEIVNLRARRKAKARADKERLAEENRLKFGQNRAERARAEKINQTEARHLDSHRLTSEPGDAEK